MCRMYIRKTGWEQDLIKDRYDSRSEHNQQKASVPSVNRAGAPGGGALSPSAGIIGGRAP